MSDVTQQKSWKQFSLREILLAMVALSALMALYATNRRGETTKLVSNLDGLALLKQIGKQASIRVDIPSYGQGASAQGSGAVHRSSSYEIRKPSTALFRTVVMPALQTKIETMLAESGCSIGSRTEGGENTMSVLHMFSLQYSRGRTRGVFRAHTVEMANGNTQLLFFVDEYP